MPYLLDGIDLATLGIQAGRGANSNIAIVGHLDLPGRMNSTSRAWGDQNGLEPYVTAEEIHLAGRDIDFNGVIKASSKTDFQTKLLQLYQHIDSFTDLVNFVTPRGTFEVFVRDQIQADYAGGGYGRIIIPFREPNPDLSGGSIPASDDPELVNGIDGVDFGALGFTVLSFGHMGIQYLSLKGILERPAPKSPNSIGYFEESYQITRTEAREYTMNCLIKKSTYAELETVVKNLYALFNSPGTRVLYLKNDVIRVVYVRNGFKVSNIHIGDTQVTALLEIYFTEASEAESEANYLLLGTVANEYVTTTIGQKIVVKV